MKKSDDPQACSSQHPDEITEPLLRHDQKQQVSSSGFLLVASRDVTYIAVGD